MRKNILLIVGLIFISANAIAAQNRVVTNDDLEKYRQKRLAAERDLRENYERLGFPSPAELDKQIEQSKVERSELAARLRAENLERERLDLERQRVELEANSRNLQYQTENSQRYEDNYSSYGTNGFYSFPNFGYQNQRLNRAYQNGYGSGYYANQNNQPRVEYRNNLPVIIPPAPPRILAPRQLNGGRRN